MSAIRVRGRLRTRREEEEEERRWLLKDNIPARYGEDQTCTAQELRNLMEFRGAEASAKINSLYGGVEGLCRRLQTDPVNGLPNDAAEFARRQKLYGMNKLPPSPSKSIFLFVWEPLRDTTLLLLMAAAAVSLGLSFYIPHSDAGSEEPRTKWIEGAAILVVVLAFVTLTSLNDWTKERQLRGLQSKIYNGNRFSVLRGGEVVDVGMDEVVVGDIGRVKYGDIFPADGVLLHSNELRIDESSFTGESDVVRKSPSYDPILLAGTHVMEGAGRFVITAVGVHSQNGIIIAKSGEGSREFSHHGDETKSVLQTKVMKLAIQLGHISIAIALLTIAILIARFCITEYIIEKQHVKISDLIDLVDYIIVGVTILVIAAPARLQLAIRQSLTNSARKMMLGNNAVRRLDVCETMGCATSICCSMTGTLMIKAFSLGTCNLNIGFHNQQSLPSSLDAATSALLVEGICVNSSYASNVLEPTTLGGQRTQIGDRTDCSLLGYVRDLGTDYNEIRKKHPEGSLVKVYTFNSIRQSMMTVIKLPHGGHRMHAKGAVETILQKCAFTIGSDGNLERFDKEERSRVEREVINQMTSEGLRTIALAYKDYVVDAPTIDWDAEEAVGERLTLIAIVGIRDTVRPEVPAAIASLQQAGLTVRMMTGENINTDRSIATTCGILQAGEDSLVMDSREFNRSVRDDMGYMNQHKFDEVWPRLRVLARAKPSDKYNLVKGIMDSHASENREIVAVIGDGTSDAPALRKSDVGIVMGTVGASVAKEASDVIIIDDNFSSSVKAVKWGRNVYESMAKSLQFQLTVNVVGVTIAFVGACAFSESPLQAVQMLWVNLIVNSLVSIALTAELPREDPLKRKPYRKTMSPISCTMLKNIVGHALYQLVVLFVLLFWGTKLPFLDIPPNDSSGANSHPSPAHYTLIFNAFVIMTLFNEINARKVHGERNILSGLLSNPTFCIIWVITLVSQWAQTLPLNTIQWAFCISVGLGELIWGQLITTIPSTIIPKSFSFGQGTVLPTPILTSGDNDPSSTASLADGAIKIESDKTTNSSARPARLLWQRGLTRLQMQMRVVGAFRSSLS